MIKIKYFTLASKNLGVARAPVPYTTSAYVTEGTKIYFLIYFTLLEWNVKN